mmetsp:Transcript_21980/g.49520  ORF Transcript_21980/g.49520 Transcript_21980/m.49520 type:complete len:157 (+) Transcript_21980:643-1113(+)
MFGFLTNGCQLAAIIGMIDAFGSTYFVVHLALATTLGQIGYIALTEVIAQQELTDTKKLKCLMHTQALLGIAIAAGCYLITQIQDSNPNRPANTARNASRASDPVLGAQSLSSFRAASMPGFNAERSVLKSPALSQSASIRAGPGRSSSLSGHLGC